MKTKSDVDPKHYPFGLGKHPREWHRKPLDFVALKKHVGEWKKLGSNGSQLPEVCPLLEYYPYTKRTKYQGGMFGKVDLLNPPARWFQRFRSKDALIAEIYRDVGRAMHYVTIHNQDMGYANQAAHAFSMWSLLTQGRFINQPYEAIPRPLKKTAMKDERARERESGNKRTPSMRRLNAAYRLVQWAEHGRHVGIHPKMETFNVQQLRDIAVQVWDAFENMC
jgi:hypothetical protein